MQLYAITGGLQAPTDTAGLDHLVELVRQWAEGGVHYIQLREKALTPTQLASLADHIRSEVDLKQSKLLVNLPGPASPSTARTDGVHLAGPLTPGAIDAVRRSFLADGREAIVSVPCHSLAEVEQARKDKASLILFSPIFEKGDVPPQGVALLQQACMVAEHVPVFALGGVTVNNVPACRAAGAAGVAGIRLFSEVQWRKLITT